MHKTRSKISKEILSMIDNAVKDAKYLSYIQKLESSMDYKERFKGEFLSLSRRITKLYRMLQKWEKGELHFTPTCPKELLEKQLAIMIDYSDVLLERAKIEGVDLEEK